MGVLDDAIREHLELKRKHGTPEHELERQEKEALDTGALPSEPGMGEPAASPEPDDRSEASDPGERLEPSELTELGLDAPSGGGESLERTSQALTDPPEGSSLADIDELEPDEVLPMEVLEPEPREPEKGPIDEMSSPGGPDEVDEVRSEWSVDRQSNGGAEAEDVLEETPDFLEETPEHDRLWFEQRPPKDFDFDD
jgi:hypothetical protein